MNSEHTGIQASRPEESSVPLFERIASPLPRCKMAKIITNAAYRKSRGTDKPFTGSEEQSNAIWNEFIRQEKRYPPRATPPAKPASKPAK